MGFLLLFACAFLAPRGGEVVLLSGTGRACPEAYLGAEALVLRLDGAEIPALLEETSVLDLASNGTRPSREELLRLRGPRALHLVGVGDGGLGWWRVMTWRGRRSPLQRALRDARARGAAVVGWGAGGAYLAEAWLAPSAALEAAGHPERNPRRAEEEEKVVGGLDLLPGGLAVQGERALPRALSLLHRRRAPRALLLAGEVAWRHDPAAREVTVTGSGAALLLETKGARCTRERIEGARASLLREGDRWDLHADRIELAGEEAGPEGVRRAPLALASLLELSGAPARLVLGEGPTMDVQPGRAGKGRFARAPLRVEGLPPR